jgi:hypothetical protein
MTISNLPKPTLPPTTSVKTASTQYPELQKRVAQKSQQQKKPALTAQQVVDRFDAAVGKDKIILHVNGNDSKSTKFRRFDDSVVKAIDLLAANPKTRDLLNKFVALAEKSDMPVLIVGLDKIEYRGEGRENAVGYAFINGKKHLVIRFPFEADSGTDAPKGGCNDDFPVVADQAGVAAMFAHEVLGHGLDYLQGGTAGVDRIYKTPAENNNACPPGSANAGESQFPNRGEENAVKIENLIRPPNNQRSTY